MREGKGVRKDYYNLFNYINLNLFCNNLVIGLLDFKRTGSKPKEINSWFETIEQIFKKYRDWSPPKADTLVDNLLNSEEEQLLITQSLEDMAVKKVSEAQSEEERILQNVRKIKEADAITVQIESTIDYVVDFLMILSDYTVIAQDMGRSFPYSRQKAVEVSLK